MKRLIVIFFLVFLPYCFSLGNTFVWDDEQFIVENVYVQNLSLWPEYFTTSVTEGAGIRSNYYRPITTLSFAIDHALWGMSPLAFHFTNAVLHAFAAVLIYVVFLRLGGSIGTWIPTAAAFVAAVAFGLHPAQVEAVVYANSRGDSLSLVFGLAAVVLLLSSHQKTTQNKKLLIGVGSAFLFLFAILSKESAIAFAVIPLLLVIVHRWKDSLRPELVAQMVAWVVLSVLYLAARFSFLSFQPISELWGNSAYGSSVVVRLSTFVAHAFPEYLSILFYPVRLHMERDVPIITSSSTIDWTKGIIGLAGFLAIAAIVSTIRRYKKESLPSVLLGLCWLAVFLAPFSGIIPINAILYEHWLYVSMAGWWLVIAVVTSAFFPKKLFLVFWVILLSVWALGSVRQMLIWKDPLTFYTYTLQFAESARLRNNLAMSLAEAGQVEAAIVEYKRSIEISPSYPHTFHNLGNAYRDTGRIEEARDAYKHALALDPGFLFSMNALIELEYQQGRYNEALQWVERGLELLPNHPQLLNAKSVLERTIQQNKSAL